MPATVGQLGRAAIAQRLQGAGLCLRTGPFVFNLRSPHRLLHEGVSLLYGEYPLAGPDEYVDFDLSIEHGKGVRRWYKPQAQFFLDGQAIFEPLPASHAYPLMEWAMNACISGTAHQYLMLHAAVVERHGLAAILPAPPGSGKSTLCAGLIHAGWRLLSDELTLLSLDGPLTATPLCRPVSLKNQSIDIIGAWAPQAVFTPAALTESKGRVAHMKVASAHLRRVGETAVPRWVVFPRWQAGSAAQMRPRAASAGLVELARNAFNFGLLGERGFRRLATTMDQCRCLDFTYSRLEDAVAAFDALVEEAVQGGAPAASAVQAVAA